MNWHGTAGRLLVGMAIVIQVGGCTTGAGPGTVPPPPSPSDVVASPTTSSTPTTTPAPTPSVVVTNDLAYEPDNAPLDERLLDVYAPAAAGPWPVVVMFGAAGKSYQGLYARRVADLGFVVFVPAWGAVWPPQASDVLAGNAQAACAVEFARAHAAEYGGDPATMIAFGHSAGALPATMVAFARTQPTTGCLGGDSLGEIDAVVTWEGNWLLSLTHPVIQDWDSILAADPRIMDAVTPWNYLANNTNLKVVMLVSEDPRASLESEYPGVIVDREVGDAWAADSWLAVRDPSGDLRRRLEANGALADGTLEFVEVQELLFSVLKAQGNPVTLDVMPGSSHAYLGDAGWPVFLAAFEKAAKQD
jgi:acetyl esterase/lipase